MCGSPGVADVICFVMLIESISQFPLVVPT